MVSNRGPSAYQPNALPLGQTGARRFQPNYRRIYYTMVSWSWKEIFIFTIKFTEGDDKAETE